MVGSLGKSVGRLAVWMAVSRNGDQKSIRLGVLMRVNEHSEHKICYTQITEFPQNQQEAEFCL